MDYDALVAKVIELLQREKRVPYRVLKRRFALDDDYLEDLKEELIHAQRVATDEEGRILVWSGDAGTPRSPAVPPLWGGAGAAPQPRSPQGSCA